MPADRQIDAKAPGFEMVMIDDASDPRIGAFVDIKERDLVGRDGLFIAEGEVVLRVLLGRSRHHIVSVLIAQQRLAALSDLLSTVPPAVPVYAASQPVMDRIVGFPMHRGVLAIGRRTSLPTASDLLDGLGPRAVVVALFGIANHDNIGGIFRNAAGARRRCDPSSIGVAATHSTGRRSGSRSGQRWSFRLRASTRTAMHSPCCAGRGSNRSPSVRRGEPLSAISSVPIGSRSSSGRKGRAFHRSLLAEARTVSIPMAGGFDSLNVATTSGIVLHHLNQDFSAAR